ncbi:MAG: hypothetical protein H7Y36_08220, partial [Armatimonadetes bacterium]|nr:hypothetical protein [Akkermansiaceae bacterium]
EMTIRTKDGELITLSYKDISEGKITVKDKDGNTTRIGSADLSQVPAWVPKAPDITDGISTYHSDTANEITGQFSGKSDQTMEQLKVFFDAETSTLGFGSNSSKSMNLNDTNVITNSYSGDGKTLTIIITEKSGEKTLINTNYTEKK